MITDFTTRQGARQCLSVYINSFNFMELNEDHDLWFDIVEYFTHE